MPNAEALEHYTRVVDVLREIRQVQASVFKNADWVKAVKVSLCHINPARIIIDRLNRCPNLLKLFCNGVINEDLLRGRQPL